MAYVKSFHSLGVCNGCGKETVIQNKTKKLCKKCVYERNHINERNGSGNVERSSSNSFNRARQQKTQSHTGHNKQTGERDLFARIWTTRPHICVNCGQSLGSIGKVFMFSHIKPKSTHPELRLEESNVELLCYDCHYARDFRGQEEFEKRRRDYGEP